MRRQSDLNECGTGFGFLIGVSADRFLDVKCVRPVHVHLLQQGDNRTGDSQGAGNQRHALVEV